MMSRILCRTNSSGYRSGSVVSTASSRMTTAFSRLPPLIRPFLIRYSISSKKQNVRAWARFLLPGLGRDFEAEELGEPPGFVRAGAGDLEAGRAGKIAIKRLARFQFERLR